jgi:tRNA-2-methylthio-N6-dimethylallyladenosine synthase
VDEIALAENRQQAGREVEVLVAVGEGRKDDATRRMSGRARDNRLVHFRPSQEAPPRPGDIVVTTVTDAAPHYLIADAAPHRVHRTRGGDAWQARQAVAGLADPAPGAVLLGMPTRAARA